MSSPYFDSKCKINKAVIVSGVSKLGHNTVITENWKPRVDVSEKGNVTMRRFRATIVAVEKQCVLLNLCVCVCVFVALVIHHEMRLHPIFICGTPGSTIFFHIFS
jgi:formate hydrogenlyase subunit 6/NADH:ubiquinone oxidoreductase subunit I